MSDFMDTFNKNIRDPSIWAEVRANHAKLNGCPRHHVNPVGRKFGERVKCLHCGGTMPATDMHYYIKGYKAGGGDANDIWPDYEKPS